MVMETAPIYIQPLCILTTISTAISNHIFISGIWNVLFDLIHILGESVKFNFCIIEKQNN